MQIKNPEFINVQHENSKHCQSWTDVKPRAKSKQCKTQNKISQDDVNGGFKGQASFFGPVMYGVE